MKKADGNLYFRRLFAYILIPFFAGPFSGGLPTPAITMRPPEASAICRSREGIRAAVLSSFGSSSAVSCRSRHTSLSSSASFPSLSSIGLRLCCILRSISVRSVFRAVSSGSLRQNFPPLPAGREYLSPVPRSFSGIFPVSARWSRARG